VTQEQERRRGQRHNAYLAAEITSNAGRASISVIKDVSADGLLLLTHAKLTAGQTVTLRIHRPGDEEHPVELSGTVVRSEPFAPDEVGTWSEKVAFKFRESQPELASEFAALAERQARLIPRASGSLPPASG
jgi:hypothetical protein